MITVSSAAADDTGLGSLETCLAQNKSLSVLFLVDTSQSLKKTDPTAQRVQGLQAAVRALSALKTSTEAAKQSLPIYVDFLEFGSTTRRSFPAIPEWQQIGADSSALETAVGDYASKTNAEDTDYVSALEPWVDRSAKPADEVGALELLGRAPANSCRLLVWFTDGKLEMDYQHQPKTLHWVEPPLELNSEASQKPAEAAAIDELCKSGGLADRLRTGDIANGEGAEVAVVALGSTTSFDLISAIAQGQGSLGPCGSQPARGIFVPANSLDQLSYGLITAVRGNGDGAPSGGAGIPSCPAGQDICTSKDPQVQVFDYPFTLSGGLVAFNLVTLSGDPSVTAALIAPDMSEYALGGSESTVLPNGVALNVTEVGSSGAVHQVDALLPGDQAGWQGLWRVRYRTSDPSKADEILNRAAIFVFGNLEARLRAASPLRIGRTGSFTVELVAAAGQPATDSAFAAGSTLTVLANGQPLPTPAVNPDGTFVFDYAVPPDFTGDSISLSAKLDPVIRLSPDAPDVHLPSWEGDLGKLQVLPVPQYPLITLKSDSLGTFDQDHRKLTATVEVDATAPDAGGCVNIGKAFEFAEFKGMKGTPSIEIRDGGTVVMAGDECGVRVETGEKRELTVNVSLDGATFISEGSLKATGVLHATSAIDPSKSGDSPIVISAKVKPIVDTSTNWTSVMLYTLGALLLPIVLLYLYNVIAAKLAVGETQRASAWLLEVPVRLKDGRLVRLVQGRAGTEERSMQFTEEDYRRIAGPGEAYARSVDAGRVVLKARMPKSPFGDTLGIIEAEGAGFVVGPLGTTRKSSVGRMPLTTMRAWAFSSALPVKVVGTDGVEPLDGTLTFFLPFDMNAAQQEVARVLLDVDDRVQSMALRHAVTPTPPPVAPDQGPTAAERPSGRHGHATPSAPPANSASNDPFAPGSAGSSGGAPGSSGSGSGSGTGFSTGSSSSDDVPF